MPGVIRRRALNIGEIVGSEIKLFSSRKDNKRNLRLSKVGKEAEIKAEKGKSILFPPPPFMLSVSAAAALWPRLAIGNRSEHVRRRRKVYLRFDRSDTGR